MTINRDTKDVNLKTLLMQQHPTTIAEDECSVIVNTIEELVEWLQEQYGIAKEKAKRQADKFKKRIEQLKKINGTLVPVSKQ